MVDNYVEQIRDFIVEKALIQFSNVKSMGLAPNRINLIIQSRTKPSEDFLNIKNDNFTKSYMEDDGYYVLVLVGLNTQETVDEIKKALL